MHHIHACMGVVLAFGKTCFAAQVAGSGHIMAAREALGKPLYLERFSVTIIIGQAIVRPALFMMGDVGDTVPYLGNELCAPHNPSLGSFMLTCCTQCISVVWAGIQQTHGRF